MIQEVQENILGDELLLNSFIHPKVEIQSLILEASNQVGKSYSNDFDCYSFVCNTLANTGCYLPSYDIKLKDVFESAIQFSVFNKLLDISTFFQEVRKGIVCGVFLFKKYFYDENRVEYHAGLWFFLESPLNMVMLIHNRKTALLPEWINEWNSEGVICNIIKLDQLEAFINFYNLNNLQEAKKNVLYEFYI